MLRFVILLSILLVFSSVHAEQKHFVVGVVPQFEPRELHNIWHPILTYLSEQSGHHFELRGMPSIPAFEKALLRGEFDFVYANPYHLLLANQQQGYQPLLRDVGRTLYGILVIPKDSPIQSPSELNGKSVAFPAPNALGASLMMQADLLDQFNSRVIPHFVKTHDSVYLNVILQHSVAGGGVQNVLNQQSQQIQNSLRILYKTREVAPHPIAAHPRVSAEDQLQFVDLMLRWGESHEGREVLSKIPMKEIGLASLVDYLPLSEMGLERFYQGGQ